MESIALSANGLSPSLSFICAAVILPKIMIGFADVTDDTPIFT
jgi:hypothetical protein